MIGTFKKPVPFLCKQALIYCEFCFEFNTKISIFRREFRAKTSTNGQKLKIKMSESIAQKKTLDKL